MPTKQMYEIEVVEREDERIKIHYIGYSDKYDEWKLKSKTLFFLQETSETQAR